MPTPLEQFGPIDIYLFDQLLKGRITPGMTLLDAGCGAGRNIEYFLREGYTVLAADIDPAAAGSIPAANFSAEPVESMSFPDACADVVLSSAVLHFARDDAHFQAMLRGSWRVLRPGGLFFCRLASSIGIEDKIELIEGRRYLLPDGSVRYLVDAELLAEATAALGATLADPIKTTVVQDQRSMTTWVLRKND